MRPILTLLFFVAVSSLAGQTPGDLVPNSGSVAKYSNLIFTVDKLEASVAFYRDLIGLEVLSLRRGSPDDRVVGPYVAKVSGSPPAVVFSSAILRLPGTSFNLLLTEFRNVDRIRREAKPRDTNATMLVLIVKDLDRIYEALQKSRVRIVTRGSAPLELPDRSRSVVARDVDGFLVQFVQAAQVPPTGSAEGQNILSAHVRLTVNNLEATAAFYSNLLGFDISPASAQTSNFYTQNLLNEPRARWQTSTGGLSGTGQAFEFIEYKGRKNASPFKSLRDPGTPAFSLGVRSIDDLVAAMKANGAPIVSDGAGPVVSPNGGRNVFVRDPSSFFLELEGPTDH